MRAEAGGPAGDMAGRVVASYRFEQLVGRGGMGEVYRARDERLNRPVAIKVLPRSLAENDTARSRFVREARLACKVVHPYVATVFDVLEDGEQLMLVMEYIGGRTLSAVLREGRLPYSKATGYGIEIAEALSAIHGAGLVHRDLKPGNVMITREGHVKVTDFGVARAVEPESADATTMTLDPTLTKEGHGVGTVLYMSPEQLRGERVDQRSDLFSLGTMLYEAITGTHPFARASVADTASAILRDPPSGGEEPPSLTDSGPLREIVHRLLAKEKDRRYQRATDVVADLRGTELSRQPGLIPVTAKLRPLRRISAATALTAAVAIVAFLLVRHWRAPPAAHTVEARPALAVLPFADRTGGAVDDLRGEMIASLLSAALFDADVLRTVGRQRLDDVLEGLESAPGGPPSPSAIAAAVGARWVVRGELFHDGDSYRAAVELYERGSPDPVGVFEAGAAGPIGIVDRAAGAVVSTLFPAAQGPRATSTFLLTGSEEAALLEQRARKALRGQRMTEGISLLRRAVEIDPRFFLARGRLAVALFDVGHITEARTTGQEALRSLEASHPDPPAWLQLTTRAQVAVANDDADRTRELRQEMARLYPDVPEFHRMLGRSLLLAGDAEAALAEAERALALDPGDPNGLVARADALRELGRYAEAARNLDDAEALFRKLASLCGTALVAEHRGALLERQGDLPASLATRQKAADLLRESGYPHLAASIDRNVADMAVRTGQLSTALDLYASVAKSARQVGDDRLLVAALGNGGSALLAAGRVHEAESRLQEATATAREMGNPRVLSNLLQQLASLLVFTGRTHEGRAVIREALDLPADPGVDRSLAQTLLGTIQIQDGELRAATVTYADAAAASGTPQLGVWARLGEAEARVYIGDLSRAESLAREAVTLADQTADAQLRGYARWHLARALGELGERTRASELLAEIEGAEDFAVYDDLRARVHALRGAMAAFHGQWTEAEAQFDACRSLAERLGVAELNSAALVGLAGVRLARNEPAKAIVLSNEVLQTAGVAAVDRNRARILLARALLAADPARASHEARLAFDRAHAMETPLNEAQAAALLLGLSGVETIPDEEAVKRRAAAALSIALDGAGNHVTTFKQRADVAELLSLLEP